MCNILCKIFFPEKTSEKKTAMIHFFKSLPWMTVKENMTLKSAFSFLICSNMLVWLKWMKNISYHTEIQVDMDDLADPLRLCWGPVGILRPHFLRWLIFMRIFNHFARFNISLWSRMGKGTGLCMNMGSWLGGWVIGFEEREEELLPQGILFHCPSWRRRQWHPTPVLLPGKSHGWRSLVGYSPWGREESHTTERIHFPFSLSCIGEGNGNPLQCSCLENPRDGGAWWASIYGVAQNRTRLKRLSSSSSSSWYMNLTICLITGLRHWMLLFKCKFTNRSSSKPVRNGINCNAQS